MKTEIDTRRRRLIYRASHRGIKEMDLILGRFAEDHVFNMDAEELSQFEALIGVIDQDLYGWVTGNIDVPADFDTPVIRAIQAYCQAGLTSLGSHGAEAGEN